MSEFSSIKCPSVHLDMPNDVYHSQKNFVSSTQLKNILISPYYYKWNLTQKHKDTPALLFGSQYHSYMESWQKVNSEDLFFKEWILLENFDTLPVNPTSGKLFGIETQKFQLWAQINNVNPSKIIEKETVETLREMRSRIINNMQIRQLIKGAVAEYSGFCRIEGIKCRYRTDLRKETKNRRIIMDWKTTTDNGNDIILQYFINNIAKDRYHFSAAFYKDQDLLIHGQKETDFAWIIQEKQPPYECDILFMSEQMYNVGQSEYQLALEQLKQCQSINEWPGQEVFTEIYEERRVEKYIDLPGWYFNKLAKLQYHNYKGKTIFID